MTMFLWGAIAAGLFWIAVCLLTWLLLNLNARRDADQRLAAWRRIQRHALRRPS